MRASIAAQTRSGAAPRARVLGDGEQAVDRQHRLAGAEGQALRHRAGGAQAGEGAGAAAEGDRVEIGERDAGIGEQAEDRRQQRRRGLRAAAASCDQRRVAAAQGDRHALGRGVEGEQRPCMRHEFSGRSRRVRSIAVPCDHRRRIASAPRRCLRCWRWRARRAGRRVGRRRAARRAADGARPAARGRGGAGARPACRATRWSRGSQEVGATAAAPRLAGRPAGQPGVADEAASRPTPASSCSARPTPGRRRCGCRAPVADGVLAGQPRHQGHRRSEARPRAHLAAAAARAAGRRARDPRRHRRSTAAPSRAGEVNPADFDGEPLRPYNVGADALLLNYRVGAADASRPTRRAASPRSPSIRRSPACASTPPCRCVGGPCDDWRGALKAEFADPARHALRRRLPGRLRREGLADRLRRPEELQRARPGRPVARAGRQAHRRRARRRRARRRRRASSCARRRWPRSSATSTSSATT